MRRLSAIFLVLIFTACTSKSNERYYLNKRQIQTEINDSIRYEHTTYNGLIFGISYTYLNNTLYSINMNKFDDTKFRALYDENGTFLKYFGEPYFTYLLRPNLLMIFAFNGPTNDVIFKRNHKEVDLIKWDTLVECALLSNFDDDSLSITYVDSTYEMNLRYTFNVISGASKKLSNN